MFVFPTERVIDTLNDDREFLPFERPDGTLIIVAKKTILRLSPLEIGRQVDSRDPYDLLGVPMTASDAEVQEAYHRAVGAVHPDRVHSLGLPADFLEMATRKAAQLNDAYRKIKAVRKAESGRRVARAADPTGAPARNNRQSNIAAACHCLTSSLPSASSSPLISPWRRTRAWGPRARGGGTPFRLGLWRDRGAAADLDRAGGRGRAGGALLGAAGVDGGDSAAGHAARLAFPGVRVHAEQSDREPGIGAAGAARGHGHPRRHAQSGDVGPRPVGAGAPRRGGGGCGGAALCRVRRAGAAVPAAHRGQAAREMGRGGVGGFCCAVFQRAVRRDGAGPRAAQVAGDRMACGSQPRRRSTLTILLWLHPKIAGVPAW